MIKCPRCNFHKLTDKKQIMELFGNHELICKNCQLKITLDLINKILITHYELVSTIINDVYGFDIK